MLAALAGVDWLWLAVAALAALVVGYVVGQRR
jgi:hypothetical protein